MTKSTNIRKDFEKCKVVNVVREIKPDNPLYNKMERLLGNRKQLPHNVEKIILRMKKMGFFNFQPIIVYITEDNKVIVKIDGEHRALAAMYLKIPMYVMECKVKDSEIGDITMMLNSGKTNWTLMDYAKYYAKQKDDKKVARAYKKFLDHLANNLVTAGVLIAIYNKKISRQETLKDNKYVSLTKGDGGNIIFKSGGLTYDRDNEHHIEDILCKIRTLETAAMYMPLTHKTIKKQQFQQALLYNLSTPCFDFDRFLKNLCCSRHQFNSFAKEVDMRAEMVRIHNKKVRK
tara:strand:- start:18 stop:884 length:867 start_codon:yes stop_codon:yes gene_type:complete